KEDLTWVRLPRLPIHYFNQLAVTRIGNHIGRTIRLDLATSEGARARYARVCVEVDISKPLLGKYMIEDRTFLVEYESLKNIYHSCGIYGHKIDNCLAKTTPPTATDAEPLSDETMAVAPEGDVGNWMTVCSRNKKKSKEAKPVDKSTKASGSRFTVLHAKDGVPSSQAPGGSAIETGKVTDPITVKLAADLATVLGAASADPKGTTKIEISTKVATEGRDPLSDISNVTKAKKQAKGVGKTKIPPAIPTGSTNLVQVLVTY
ncbi:hypothetical protein LINPERHAP1_LOCUS28865, partial [Linum perenne]